MNLGSASGIHEGKEEEAPQVPVEQVGPAEGLAEQVGPAHERVNGESPEKDRLGVTLDLHQEVKMTTTITLTGRVMENSNARPTTALLGMTKLRGESPSGQSS